MNFQFKKNQFKRTEMYVLSYKMMKCDKYLENSDNTNLIQAT